MRLFFWQVTNFPVYITTTALNPTSDSLVMFLRSQNFNEFLLSTKPYYVNRTFCKDGKKTFVLGMIRKLLLRLWHKSEYHCVLCVR